MPGDADARLDDLEHGASKYGESTQHPKRHGTDAHVPRQNFSAIVAPAVTDDSSKGYGPGSVWVDLTADRYYICTDGTVGAAVWHIADAGFLTLLSTQIIIPASALDVHASNPKSAVVPWTAAVGGTFTFTLYYHTVPTASTAQTWLLQRSAAGGAFATVITFTCASTNPMLYKYAGDVTITVAQHDRLILLHTVGDASGTLVTAAGVRSA